MKLSYYHPKKFDLKQVTELKSLSSLSPVTTTFPSGFTNRSSVVAAELDYYYHLTDRFLTRNNDGEIEAELEFLFAEFGTNIIWAEYLQYRFETAIGFVELSDQLGLDATRLSPLSKLRNFDLISVPIDGDLKRAILLLNGEGTLVVDCGAVLSTELIGRLFVLSNLFEKFSLVVPSTNEGRYYAIAEKRNVGANWFSELKPRFGYKLEVTDLVKTVNKLPTRDPRLEYRNYIEWRIPSDASDHLPPPHVCIPRETGFRGRGETRGRGRGETRGRGRGEGGRGRGKRDEGETHGRGRDEGGRGGKTRGRGRGGREGGEPRGRGRGRKNE